MILCIGCHGFRCQVASRIITSPSCRSLLSSPLVHPSSVLRKDDEGVFPNYVVYHELISTSHPYMRNVCEVEMEWVTPILQKLEKLNVKILSGGSNQPEKTTDNSDVPKKDVKAAAPADDAQSRIQAARERFLARKGNK
ncbi:probable pre-mRNA-splicing factor ATP-dependent RNA helicase DEAH4 isoform X2 [Tanacetum coccineum]